MDQPVRAVTTERFVFLGCLIVRWLDPLAETSEMRRYRGVDRLTFSSAHLTPDANPPAGRLAALCKKFLQYEDLFEYISDPQAAVILYRELNEYDPSYELIACGVEDRLVDELQWRGENEVLGSRSDDDERARLEGLKLRLLGRPSAPRWPVLGYDVSELGHFYSPVFHEVLRGNFPEYDRYVNSAGLFSSASIATNFLARYGTYSHRELGHYYVYEVRAASAEDLLAVRST